MSMTSDEARKTACVFGEGNCKGRYCPKWIQERRKARSAGDCYMLCTRTVAKDGSFDFNYQVPDQRHGCMYKRGLSSCMECGEVYGHCSAGR